MGIPKVDEATTIAREAIHDAAPGLLTMTEVAEKVRVTAGVSIGTARNRLRAAVEAGGLLELAPWSRRFVVELPGAKDAGVGPFYIAREATGSPMYDIRYVITTDDSKMRPSSYGPGRTTYLVDPEQAREYVQQLADQKKAKEDAKAVQRKAEQKAEASEINRRFPSLRRLLRTVRYLSERNAQTRRGSSHNVWLDDVERTNAPLEERELSVTLHTWGDESVTVLQSILEAGLAVYIEKQPVTLCAHDGRRILSTPTADGLYWWHADTAASSCGKDTDTKAEPAEEN